MQIAKYQKIKSAMDMLGYRLKDALDVKNLPKEVVKEILLFKQKMSEFNLENYKDKKKLLTGKIASAQEVLETIKEATGYTKWSLDQMDEITDDERVYFKDAFAVDYDETQLQKYYFVREASSRDSVWLITVIALPEHFYVKIDTDRADYSFDKLLTEQEMKMGLEKEID